MRQHLHRNVGSLDRLIRLTLAAAAVVGAIATTGSISVVLWIVATIGLISGITGWALPYAILHMNTRR